MAETQIANISIKGLKKHRPKLESDGMILPFYQSRKTLQDLDAYTKFIKGVETLVRNSREYRAYIAYLKEDIGLNYCSVFPNIIEDTDKSHLLEMHHGPILTLYDCASIITDYLLNTKCKEITSFMVARMLIDEHLDNNIQVMMLCKLAHKLVTNGYIYLNPRHSWGNLDNFLKKYDAGIDKTMRVIINRNLEIGRTVQSTDNGLFKVNPNVENWDDKYTDVIEELKQRE